MSCALSRCTAALAAFFKLRIGDLRVVYTLDRKARRIHVHLIGHRDEIYKSRG
jgi:mRNA-degrading endonuclease RelE of RelBE toxin-antitoxin system